MMKIVTFYKYIRCHFLYKTYYLKIINYKKDLFEIDYLLIKCYTIFGLKMRIYAKITR